MPGPKEWLILGVSLTHLVESKDLFLFFLKHKYVDNIFQWAVLKIMKQINSYDGMFHAMTIHKILKTRILSRKVLQNESSFSFFSQIF